MVVVNQDGKVELFHHWLEPFQADELFDELYKSLLWKTDEIRIFGKVHRPNRKYAWLAAEPFGYKYSGSTRIATPWPTSISTLATRLHDEFQVPFNSVLVNLYHDGNDAMGYHADNEKEMDHRFPIASISLGATRDFLLKHNTSGERVSVELNSGSLLMMSPEIQDHWKHSIPVRKKVSEPRINLTFRCFSQS